MSLVFIGPPAAGKSRAGKRVAQRLRASYADTDKLFARDFPAAGGPMNTRLIRATR